MAGARNAETVGFIGVGDLGAPMAADPSRPGTARGFDIRSEAVVAALEQGAEAAPSGAARGADAVAACVADDEQVIDAVPGSGGLLAAMGSGQALIVHVSVLPEVMYHAPGLREREEVRQERAHSFKL